MLDSKKTIILISWFLFLFLTESRSQDMIKRIHEIESELEHYVDENGCRANIDGVLNPAVWFDRTPDDERVLFINKEAFTFNKDDYKNGRNLINDRKEEKFSMMEEGKPTYRVMIAISCMCCCDDDWHNVIDALKTSAQDDYWLKFFNHSAIINVKKQMKLAVGRDVYSDDLIIWEHAKRNEKLLIKQISVYNPTIVIGGNTLKYFIHDNKIFGETIVEKRDLYGDGMRYYYITPNRMYVDAYHPSSRGSYEKKIGSIKSALEDWKSRK
ncbi:MAG TPA: hypothetical protein DHV77_03520 [Erysipelotrichaceae bacterium]|nr:hypothetical protein [Erysipelotrichaceae bacterium]